MFTDTDISEVIDGTLQLDALEMRLVRRNSDEEYEGSGEVRLTPEGGILFKLYDRGTPWDLHMQRQARRLDGRDTDLFDLSFRDHKGREWRAEGFLPSSSHSLWRDGVIWRGRLHQIVHTHEYGRAVFPALLDLHFRGDIELPISPWAFTNAGAEYEVTKDQKSLSIRARRPSKAFPSGWDSRIEEAIWFCLGTPAWWALKIERYEAQETIRIREQRPGLPVFRPNQPLRLRTPEAVEDVRLMIDRFLVFVGTYEHPRYHPLAVDILRILHARATAIEMAALELGVATERIVRRHFLDEITEDASLVDSASRLRQHIDVWPTASDSDRKVRDAALEACARAPRPSIYRVLRDLAETRVIKREHPRIWKRLRNSAAHSDIEADRDLIRDVDTAHELFNLLVFSLIGYQGSYTNWASADSTTERYPLSPPAA
jgi:hypothetical protein